MAKEKFIHDEQYRQYKANLAELMQQLNPKPSKEVIEQLIKKYEDARSGK